MSADQAQETSREPGLAAALQGLIEDGEQFRQVLARQLGLGPSDLVAMAHLYRDGPLTPRTLGIRMQSTSGTMTALLDRVEKAGFLTRDKHPKDRRSLLIAITPAGQHAVRWVHDHFDVVLAQALAELEDMPSDRLAVICAGLSQSLRSHAQTEAPIYTSRPPSTTGDRPDWSQPT